MNVKQLYEGVTPVYTNKKGWIVESDIIFRKLTV